MHCSVLLALLALPAIVMALNCMEGDIENGVEKVKVESKPCVGSDYCYRVHNFVHLLSALSRLPLKELILKIRCLLAPSYH